MKKTRIEKDSLGEVHVPYDCLWGAQTERSLSHFSIGKELMPKELIKAYGWIKKAAAIVNERDGKLSKDKKDLIVLACDEILKGKYDSQFPLHVWISGSGTQFNMNVNEVIANLCSKYSDKPLGSKTPVHPNDDVNMSQSTNDTFPTAMHIAATKAVHDRLLPALDHLKKALDEKAKDWKDLVKIGRTHMQDATPLMLGQEVSGYSVLIKDSVERVKKALDEVFFLAIGGTAIGTGINAQVGFDQEMAKELAKLTGLPLKAAENKFALMGSHDALVFLSSALKTVAVSLYKIANDIRLLSSGPRAGLYELILPQNEPGSSIMPGKVNPTQCEALAMVSIQVMANDFAVTMAGAGGILEMNVYKPLIIYNLMQAIGTMTDAIESFTQHTVKGMEANKRKIREYVKNSLMLVTALSPVIGYDKAAELAHYAHEHEMTLLDAALKLGFVTLEQYDRLVDPQKMVYQQSEKP